MPGGDRSGPRGEGPRTGRGMGYCGGYGEPGWTAGNGGGAGPGRGRGRGTGQGRGRGLGRGLAWRGGRADEATPPPKARDDTLAALEQQIAALARQVEDLKANQ